MGIDAYLCANSSYTIPFQILDALCNIKEPSSDAPKMKAHEHIMHRAEWNIIRGWYEKGPLRLVAKSMATAVDQDAM